MRFLLDESASLGLAELLKEGGHDATAIVRDYTAGVADEVVLDLAVREDRVLITNDLGFGELVFRRGLPHCGVILLRVESGHVELEGQALRRVLDRYGNHIEDFIVVDERRMRARRSR